MPSLTLPVQLQVWSSHFAECCLHSSFWHNKSPATPGNEQKRWCHKGNKTDGAHSEHFHPCSDEFGEFSKRTRHLAESSLVDGVRRGQTISGSRKRLSVGQRWERSCSVARLFHVHPPAEPLRWLEKAIPAVSLSESDLRSLCSKITAPSSATVLMHMKQNGWMVRTGRTRGCTRTHACAGRRQTSGAPAI